MKTLTVSEAAGDLAGWLKLAVAGEHIAIQNNGSIVQLCPVPSETHAALTPREALRRLQQNARLTAVQADTYLDEVRAERLAAEKSAA